MNQLKLKLLISEAIDYVLLIKIDKYKYHTNERESNKNKLSSNDKTTKRIYQSEKQSNKTLGGITNTFAKPNRKSLKILRAVSSILTILRCEVKGGHPTPYVKVMISNQTIPDNEFQINTRSTMGSGVKGLRVHEYSTTLWSERLMRFVIKKV